MVNAPRRREELLVGDIIIWAAWYHGRSNWMMTTFGCGNTKPLVRMCVVGEDARDVCCRVNALMLDVELS